MAQAQAVPTSPCRAGTDRVRGFAQCMTCYPLPLPLVSGNNIVPEQLTRSPGCAVRCTTPNGDESARDMVAQHFEGERAA
jgi:hypothetical protein